MSFDTTASNTGRTNDAYILTEAKLEKHLLYFACRHHILELVMELFLTLMGPSQGSDILFSKRFQCQWELVHRAEFQTGDENDEVSLSVRK